MGGWVGVVSFKGQGTQPAQVVFHPKIEVSETYFLDIVTIHNAHPNNVKHVLGRVHVFFPLFACSVCVCWGGGVCQAIGTQPAYPGFHLAQLKN